MEKSQQVSTRDSQKTKEKVILFSNGISIKFIEYYIQFNYIQNIPLKFTLYYITFCYILYITFYFDMNVNKIRSFLNAKLLHCS